MDSEPSRRSLRIAEHLESHRGKYAVGVALWSIGWGIFTILFMDVGDIGLYVMAPFSLVAIVGGLVIYRTFRVFAQNQREKGRH